MSRQPKLDNKRLICGRTHRVASRVTLYAITLLAQTLIVASSSEAGTLSKPNTSRAARDESIKSIPFRNMTPEAQQKIAAVVKRPTMFRRMPIHQIQCDSELHQFLIRNPEVIVNIWQLQGITQVQLDRTGPYLLNASDGVGTVSTVELIYGTANYHLLYCEGSYSGPLIAGTVKGRCVLILRTRSNQSGGKNFIVDQLECFVQVDNAGLDLLTKTLHPLVGRSADINFIESTRFIERVSMTAAVTQEGMQNLAAKLENVAPATRQEFARISADIYAKAKRSGQAQLAQKTTSVK